MSSEAKRLKDLLTVARVGIDWMARARDAEAKLADLTTLHPAAEWTEADGAVLWWRSDSCSPEIAHTPSRKYQKFYFGWSRIPKVVLL